MKYARIKWVNEKLDKALKEINEVLVEAQREDLFELAEGMKAIRKNIVEYRLYKAGLEISREELRKIKK